MRKTIYLFVYYAKKKLFIIKQGEKDDGEKELQKNVPKNIKCNEMSKIITEKGHKTYIIRIKENWRL